MGVYDRQIKRAKEQISKKGQLVTWRRLVSNPNTSEPWKSDGESVVDQNVKIVFFPADSETKKFFAYLKDGTTIGGQLSGLMAAVDFEPSNKDVVIRNGKEFKIKTIDELSPNGEVILYMLEFEK